MLSRAWSSSLYMPGEMLAKREPAIEPAEELETKEQAHEVMARGHAEVLVCFIQLAGDERPCGACAVDQIEDRWSGTEHPGTVAAIGCDIEGGLDVSVRRARRWSRSRTRCSFRWKWCRVWCPNRSSRPRPLRLHCAERRRVLRHYPGQLPGESSVPFGSCRNPMMDVAAPPAIAPRTAAGIR